LLTSSTICFDFSDIIFPFSFRYYFYISEADAPSAEDAPTEDLSDTDVEVIASFIPPCDDMPSDDDLPDAVLSLDDTAALTEVLSFDDEPLTEVISFNDEPLTDALSFDDEPPEDVFSFDDEEVFSVLPLVSEPFSFDSEVLSFEPLSFLSELLSDESVPELLSP
jgi:hypothetical protein